MAPEEPGAPIARAILSVHDKTGLTSLAAGLAAGGVELWATGGTRTGLEADGVRVRAAEELTGIGSWFGGRIKTLHPGILGGILAPRTDAGRRELAERKLLPFDLVVVNFYPFERHLEEVPDAADREEYIDIGGVSLARAAAKNHAFVTVLTDPTEYGPFLEEFRDRHGSLSAASRRAFAARAFERCAEYDAAIGVGLAPTDGKTPPFPEQVVFRREPMALRYGENPHQAAAVYRGVAPGGIPVTPSPVALVKGDALSFTNLLDLDTALSIVAEFPEPTAAIVKHATPCGVASGATVRHALDGAIATDPVARYGCAIAVNRPFGPEDVAALHGVFVDLLAAPAFDSGALEPLARRPKIKLVRAQPPAAGPRRWEAKSALGRLLLQDADRRELAPGDFRLVTAREATPEERCALDFAWRVVRHAKSNAIVLAQGSRTVGIGSGQPTRVKAVELAVEVAGDRARGAVLASDAFFPFADGLEAAGRAGVRAVLQPGGSVRDAEVIAAAERHGTAMYFTGWRVFRH
ncbi:MAG TPA: bifunctional phosphoribosylaminoimidazolecarboxamide formyltransferase/IMP cyclohydrolase [Thermoplasmata archaeon]|nr:bifunctional phosphoribosylaminoimidazolecarboxamide formyltransferase/IMP cyclohydrolase [Thermoplasmata archaeon]